MNLLVLFGATGDLARRKLFPTLGTLIQHNVPEDAFQIVAIGRRPYTTEEFLTFISPTLTPEALDTLHNHIEYYQLDYAQPSSYQDLCAHLRAYQATTTLYYLAVSPFDYQQVVSSLGENDLLAVEEGNTKTIALEKPFGHNLASARVLDTTLKQWLTEEQIYRIDHYLGKETVQNILTFRFANAVFKSQWNRAAIDHIQITVAEQIGIEGRGAYYDKVGAIRDLLQNHILQLVTLLTMDEPASFTSETFAREEMKILNSLTIKPESIILGQYDGYLSEPNVAPASSTETFVMVELHIDTERWRHLPIYIRTGKSLARQITEVSVQFKEMEHDIFHLPKHKQANVVTFRIQPDEGVSLRLLAKTPGSNLEAQAVNMEFCYGPAFGMRLPEAYERMLGDILRGDSTLGLQSNIIEESWRIVDPFISECENLPRQSYPPGSWGPAAADTYLVAQGRRWLAHESTVCNGITVDN